MKDKILIVEDEVIIAMELESYLEKIGYEVLPIETSFESTINTFKQTLPDLILIDINLKRDKDGIAIAQEINKIRPTPFIFITAFSDVNTIEKAVAHNPCSFLVKPINREELKINIMLALSSRNVKKDNMIEISKECSYDTVHEVLYLSKEAIRLSKNEEKLFKLLLENKNRIVQFDLIKQEIWGKTDLAESSARTLVYRLRKKLNNTVIIETIVSIGCKLMIK